MNALANDRVALPRPPDPLIDARYATQTVIHLSPDQLGDLIDQRLAKALGQYTPPPPEGSDLPEILTRKQAAKALQVSVVTLSNWAKDTDDRPAVLAPVKMGNQVRYRREDVLALMKQSRRFKPGPNNK